MDNEFKKIPYYYYCITELSFKIVQDGMMGDGLVLERMFNVAHNSLGW